MTYFPLQGDPAGIINQEYLIGVHPIARFMTPEAALNGQPFDLHPGAARYYREIGVID